MNIKGNIVKSIKGALIFIVLCCEISWALKEQIFELDSVFIREILEESSDRKSATLLEDAYGCLKSGKVAESRDYYRKALSSKDRRLRSLAYTGLGQTFQSDKNKGKQLILNLNKALILWPENKEALYLKYKTLFDPDDFGDMLASKVVLLDLLALDLFYRDVCSIWQDSIEDKTIKEIRTVNQIIKNNLERSDIAPEIWLNMAWDELLANGPDSALCAINGIRRRFPHFNHADLYLIEARCKLSHNDYFSFQKLYWQSVDLADKENSFNRLLMDAETIFGQEDIERCTSAINQNREKEFLQYFWNSINPQKLSDINFRLVEHYKRLQYAENNYRLRMIGTRFQKSIDTNYMLSFRSLTNNFSPRDLFHKSRGKTLDTRGLLYLRFGPPDNLIIGHPENNPRMLRGTSITYNEKLMNKMEIWWYGRVPFIFEEYPFAGGFIYRTLDWPGIALGDINKAMDRQLYEDTTIVEQDDYYVVQFKDTTNYGIEVTILQEQPQGPQIRPLARAAIFDTLWQELVRFDSPVYPVNNRGDSNWLAVHSLSCLPGMQKYYFEMKSDCKSWVGGGELDLIAFKKDSLQISGIVLGIDPDENKECFNRCGVDFIPRPSFVFSRGEKVRVYLEYYNLKLAADSIGRYKEYIDVVRIEGESGILGRIKNVMTEWLSFGEQKGGTSITLAFGRESNRDFKDRAVESFILETDQLQSGKYRLLVEAYDLTSGCWDNEGVVFEIKAE